jgi:hypothetical protein
MLTVIDAHRSIIEESRQVRRLQDTSQLLARSIESTQATALKHNKHNYMCVWLSK